MRGAEIEVARDHEGVDGPLDDVLGRDARGDELGPAHALGAEEIADGDLLAGEVEPRDVGLRDEPERDVRDAGERRLGGRVARGGAHRGEDGGEGLAAEQLGAAVGSDEVVRGIEGVFGLGGQIAQAHELVDELDPEGAHHVLAGAEALRDDVAAEEHLAARDLEEGLAEARLVGQAEVHEDAIERPDHRARADLRGDALLEVDVVREAVGRVEGRRPREALIEDVDEQVDERRPRERALGHRRGARLLDDGARDLLGGRDRLRDEVVAVLLRVGARPAVFVLVFFARVLFELGRGIGR